MHTYPRHREEEIQKTNGHMAARRHMGCDARQPVFGVSQKARLKSVPSATETS